MQLNSDNCHASFGAASILVIGAFAAAASPVGASREAVGVHKPTLADMLDVIVLARGMNLVLHSSEAALHGGPFADLFLRKTYHTPQVFLEAVCGKLHELSVKVLEDHSVEQETARIVNCEIHNLIACIKESVKDASIPSMRIVFLWPTILADEFLGLLHHKASPALAVFMYYCTIVHESHPVAWYTGGWGTSVARDIKTYLQAPWTDVIQWPLDYLDLQQGH